MTLVQIGVVLGVVQEQNRLSMRFVESTNRSRNLSCTARVAKPNCSPQLGLTTHAVQVRLRDLYTVDKRLCSCTRFSLVHRYVVCVLAKRRIQAAQSTLFSSWVKRVLTISSEESCEGLFVLLNRKLCSFWLVLCMFDILKWDILRLAHCCAIFLCHLG